MGKAKENEVTFVVIDKRVEKDPGCVTSKPGYDRKASRKRCSGATLSLEVEVCKAVVGLGGLRQR